MSRRTLITAYLVLIAALLGLGWLGRDRLFARYYARQCLAHPDWRQRANAAIRLAELGATEAVPVLEAARHDVMAPVRLNAGWALRVLVGRESGGDPKGPLGLLPPWERPNLDYADRALRGVTLRATMDPVMPRLTIPEGTLTATFTLLNSRPATVALPDGTNWYRAARYLPNGVVEPVEVSGQRPALLWVRVVRREFSSDGMRVSTTTHVLRFPEENLPPGGATQTTLTIALTGATDPTLQFETLTWTAMLEPLVGGGSIYPNAVVPPVTIRAVAVRGDNPGLTALTIGELYVIADALESGTLRFDRALPVYATGYTWETNDDGSGHFGTDATASGRPASAGSNTLDRPRTLATDWTQFPKDTLCYISGLGWGRVEDKCGASVRDREKGEALPRVDCYLGKIGSKAAAEAQERAITGVRGCVVFRQ